MSNKSRTLKGCRKLHGKNRVVEGKRRKEKRRFWRGCDAFVQSQRCCIYRALFAFRSGCTRFFAFLPSSLCQFPIAHGGETCSGDRGKNIPPHRHENRIRPGPWHRSRIYDTTCLWHSRRRKMSTATCTPF